MRRWIISDTHWGHSEIQKHCRRPANADELINTNWKAMIKPEDLVIHCGDVAFTFVKLKELLTSLPGRKVLVMGNHDAHTVTWYMDNGFDFACKALVLGNILFTHHPVEVLPVRCDFNIHGHLHNRLPKGTLVYPHCRLFSLEYTDYKPRIIDKFVRRGD